MYTPVAKFVHLLHGFFRRPTLLSHAIGRDHHSSAVVPQPTMHENLLAGIFSRDFYKAFEHLILGKRTIPRQGYVGHAQILDKAFVALRSASIDDDRNSHVGKCLKSLGRRLAAAKERRRDLTEVRDALCFQMFSHGVLASGAFRVTDIFVVGLG